MVDITLADGSKLTATDSHPIWDATTGKFTDAINLRFGEKLLDGDGHQLAVTGRLDRGSIPDELRVIQRGQATRSFPRGSEPDR